MLNEWPKYGVGGMPDLARTWRKEWREEPGPRGSLSRFSDKQGVFGSAS